MKKLIKFLFEKTLNGYSGYCFEINTKNDRNFNIIYSDYSFEELYIIIMDNNSFEFLEMFIFGGKFCFTILDEKDIKLSMRNITYLKHYKLNHTILKV